MHLDKRNRLCLQKLSLAERANIILPFISEWAKQSHLSASLASIVNLQQLISEHPAIQELSKKDPVATVTSDEKKQLRHGLEGLRVQDLMKLLKPQDAPLSVQLSIETLAFELQQEWTKSKDSKQGSKANHRKGAKHRK